MKKFIGKWIHYFIFAAVFSAFINVLMLTMPLHMLQMYDRVLGSGSVPTLVVITAAALFALIIMGFLESIRSRLLVIAGIDIEKTLSEMVLGGMIKDTAQLESSGYSQGLQDIRILRNVLGGSAIFCIFDAPWVPIYLAVVYSFHFKLGVLGTVGAVLIFFLGLLNEQFTHKPLKQANMVANMSNQEVGTYLRNAQVVRSMGMVGGVTSRWHKMNDVVISLQTQASNRAGMISAFTKPVRSGLQVCLLAIGAYYVVRQECTGGVMIAASIITGRALMPVEMAIGTWKQLVEARDAYGRLNELISKKAFLPDTMELPAPEGRLTAEGVTFAAAGRAILKGIFFDLAPGESLAMIGPSAAGKSTLGRLMIGIWKPYSGSMRLDGADVFTWDQERLGKHIGYIPQDVELFSGTVAENIARMGEADSEKVIEAAKLAQVNDMVLHFPNGFDTRIGPGGIVLSGGQRQRIAMARALYDNPRLVVMDEPNSNLDEEGEKALLMVLQALKQAKVTTVVISHKINLLALVDKILVLKDGQTVMYGPRNEILQKLIPANPQIAAMPARPQAPVAVAPPAPSIIKTRIE